MGETLFELGRGWVSSDVRWFSSCLEENEALEREREYVCVCVCVCVS